MMGYRNGVLSALFAAALAAMSGSASAQSPSTGVELTLPTASQRVVIGGGMPFGLYFPLAGVLCRLMETGAAPRSCAVASISDSAAALDRIADGSVPFALVQSDWLHHAVRGTSRYAAGGARTDLRSIVAFYSEAFSVFVKATGPIKTLEDLDDKRASLGAADSYRGILADAALDVAGLDRDDLSEVTDEPVVSAIERLCEGRTDAVVVIAAHPAELLSAAGRRCGIAPLSLSLDEVTDLLDSLPGYAETVIPARTYPGQAAAVLTVGLRPVLVTTDRADPGLVSAMTTSIARGLTLLNASHPAYSQISIEDLVAAQRFAPVHPAAAQALGLSGQ